MLFPEQLHFIHGADYYPEQWLAYPDILEQDIKMMKKANINCVTLGVFSWAFLEPVEGQYHFGWLQDIIDNLFQNGIYIILATPSGAKPNWMSAKYEEILRVNVDGRRMLQCRRHNHCYTSPVYRGKTVEINKRLAKQFGSHPGVILWHLSNEYSGECYCPLCVEAFRAWLRDKYGTLEKLNHEWWSHFWSHTFTDWDQINPPYSIGETTIMGLTLDWKRFVTDQTVDFMKTEIAAIRSEDPDTPVTNNFMRFFEGLNYHKLAEHLDIVSWDSYPQWHSESATPENEIDVAVDAAMMHDIVRSIKHKPFLLMESTPGTTNHSPVSHLKKPGVHMLASMQAVAHGANSVQYFQWRQSRGSFEKFHSAVVDHTNRDDTRIFNDVTAVGKSLIELSGLETSNIPAQVAIIYDWENLWAIKGSIGPRNIGMHYLETVKEHYKCFWELGVNTDIVDMECDFSGYRLIIAPMLYLYRACISEKLEAFVKQGGVLVGTYWSGVVNENDLCFLGDRPGNGMSKVFGLRCKETDALYDHQSNRMVMCGETNKTYTLTEICEIVQAEGAEVLALYESDFYAGTPAFTRNQFGSGSAYFLAAKAEYSFLREWYSKLTDELALRPDIVQTLPEGVTVCKRRNETAYWFLQNYTKEHKEVELSRPLRYYGASQAVTKVQLPPYGVVILY